MAIKRKAGGRITGLSADAKPTAAAEPVNTIFQETDTHDEYINTGSAWVPRASAKGAAYTWLIYKTGSTYKAKNGFTGTVPSGASSTSMDTLWSWLKANYVQTGEEIGRGLIQFYKGTYTFTATGGAATIDSAWGTDTGTGPHVRGQRRDTHLIFTPSAATDSALTIDNQTDSGFQDLDIAINSNVTNAIKVSTSTPGDGSARTILENLKIRRSESDGPFVTGQRGIYLSTPTGGTSGNVFFTTLRRIYARFMETGIELAGTVGLNNTHAVNIDDCGMWGCVKAINMGDRCSQNFVGNILVQDIGATMDYAVRLGVNSNYTQVYKIGVDGAAKSGSAIVLLEDGANYNKIDGLVSSGAQVAIRDYSGQSYNEFSNITTINGPTYRQKEGRWLGGSYYLGTTDGTNTGYMYGGTGLLSGPFAAPAGTQEGYVATANTHVVIDGTEGIGTRFTTKTTPVAGDNIGMKSKFPITFRNANFRLYFRFKVGTAKGSTTDHRAWFGLWNNDLDITANNEWLNGNNGIGIGYDALAGSTTWKIVHNDGTAGAGNTIFDEVNPTTPITNNNTNVHQCIIQYETTPTPRCLVNMDGGTLRSITTQIPTAFAPLRLAMGIEITNTAAHSVDIFDIKINQWM